MRKRIEVILNPFQQFFNLEASGGIVLMAFLLLALIIANTGAANFYHKIWETTLTIRLGGFELSKSLHHWINDGLMTVFFFLVGLEIKREVLIGELSSLKQASLPVFAAIGGMVVPSLVFVALNRTPGAESGWAVPMATDIALSLGVLSLLGKRVPLSLKVFLTAFAIVDDIGAVLVIALFYSHDPEWIYLVSSLGLLIVLVFMNRFQVRAMWPYFVIGILLWYAVLKSGIHPTIAGVALAFNIPVGRKTRLMTFKRRMSGYLSDLNARHDESLPVLTNEQMEILENMEEEITLVQSPLQVLEHKWHGFVIFVVMPLFVFANSGISLGSGAGVFSNLSLSIGLGLLLGKVAGILIFTYLAVKLKLAEMLKDANWMDIIGVGLLGGIGFTMSIFISDLAFDTPHLLALAKYGIFSGSLLAGISGYLVLYFRINAKKK
jgi:NhaA family Na+:H+ antiporter